MAITEQKKREQNRREGLILFFFLYLTGAVYSIHLGAVYELFPEFTFLQLDALLKAGATHLRGQPFFIPDPLSMSFRFWAGFSIVFFAVFVWWLTSQRKTMKGKEHGSARWGTKAESKQIRDREFNKNIILTATECLSLNGRKTHKNLNILLYGDSGAGKTRSFIKPNIMQMHTSYVITDLKGELLQDTEKMLAEHGYEIRVLNLIDMEHSHCYSPFAYLRKDEDVLRLITSLVKNTTPPEAHQNDPFWEKAETALLQALCYFIWYRLPEVEQNFNSVMRLLRLVSIDEDDNNKKSDLDLLFDQLRKEYPNHIAVVQYDIFKQAAGKTAKSIVISAAVRLAAFNIDAVANLTQKDTLHLEDLYEKKAALFVLIPPGDVTFNFIAAMLYSQMFQFFRNVAFEQPNKSLPNHVRFLLDEFANIGTIPDFGEMVSVMRSMGFSVSIVLQNLEQLEKGYKDSAKTIMANCNTKLFLGGEEQSTTKLVSEMLGKETIDSTTHTLTRGRQRSITRNDQIQGRELLMPDEVARIPDTDCILMIRGMHPFYSKKYDITKHPKYKELYDPKEMPENTFDYRTIVTPKRELKTTLQKEEGQKNTKEIRLADIQLGVAAIQKLRYAVEYEF